MVVRINKKQADDLGLTAKRAKRKKIAVPLNGTQCAQVYLDVPHPPSVNHHYIHGRGRVFLSKEANLFRKSFSFAALGLGHVAGKIEVTLWQSGRFDADACIKEVLDAAQRCGVIANDDQVMKITIWRRDDSNPLMTVKFRGEMPARLTT